MARKLRERGQSLVEYALTLVLVAVVVIAIAVVFGQSVQKMYCELVYTLDPQVDIDACESIDVTCNAQEVGAGYIRLEAVVSDNAGSGSDIQRVDFFVDGNFTHSEFEVHYCINGDNAIPCNKKSVSSGSHTFSAIAHDAEGNTGSCEVTRVIP